jgi:hypothetical protein
MWSKNVKRVEYQKGKKCQTLLMKVLADSCCAVWCCAIQFWEDQQKQGSKLRVWEEKCGSKRKRELQRTINDTVNALVLHFLKYHGMNSLYWFLGQSFKQKPGNFTAAPC